MNVFADADGRKGVTPVIAVLLLLMMTVAAAGGAYVWMTSLQEQLRGQTQEEVEGFDRGVSMSDLRCINITESQDNVTFLLRNTGDKELDVEPMDLEVRDADTENIRSGLSNFSFDLNDSIHDGQGNGAISPGGTALYTVKVGSSDDTDALSSDELYQVNLIFKDEDDYDISGTCRVEEE